MKLWDMEITNVWMKTAFERMVVRQTKCAPLKLNVASFQSPMEVPTSSGERTRPLPPFMGRWNAIRVRFSVKIGRFWMSATTWHHSALQIVFALASIVEAEKLARLHVMHWRVLSTLNCILEARFEWKSRLSVQKRAPVVVESLQRA